MISTGWDGTWEELALSLKHVETHGLLETALLPPQSGNIGTCGPKFFDVLLEDIGLLGSMRLGVNKPQTDSMDTLVFREGSGTATERCHAS